MAGHAQDIEDAVAEVELARAGGPLGDAKGLLDNTYLGRDDFDARPPGELAVTRLVIAMVVGMRYEELWFWASMPVAPLDDEAVDEAGQLGFASTSIE